MERALEAFVAISKNLTINELNNAWNYKYIFNVASYPTQNVKSAYEYPKQSLCRNLLNVITFFCRCRSRSMKHQRKQT